MTPKTIAIVLPLLAIIATTVAIAMAHKKDSDAQD
jgi:hypothetical protein